VNSINRRLNGLDALRGIAVLLVVSFHVATSFAPHQLYGHVFGYGYMGVQLFFLISAVTMCHMWSQRSGEPSPALAFWIRRATRIVPLFWFALFFYYFIGLFQTPEQPITSLQNLLLVAFFFQGFSFDAINQIVPGGWSIAVEMCFYFLFPVFVSALKGATFRIFTAFVVYVVFTFISTWFNINTKGEQSTFIYFSLLTQLPVFLVGMAIFETATSEKFAPPWVLVGVCCIWVVFAVVAGRLGFLARPGFWLPVFILAAFVAVLASRWSHYWLESVGQKSYSIYLFHFAIVELVGFLLGGFARSGLFGFLTALMVSIGGALVVGTLSAKYLESASARFGSYLLNHLSKSWSK